MIFFLIVIFFNKSEHQVLGHQSNQGPSPSIAQFGQEASSRKSPGCFKLIQLRVTEICFCEPPVKLIFFWTLPQMCGLTQSCFWALQAVDLSAWFLLWYAFSAVRSFIKTCVPFQIIPIQLNLPQVSFTRILEISTNNMNAPELNFSCPRNTSAV